MEGEGMVLSWDQLKEGLALKEAKEKALEEELLQLKSKVLVVEEKCAGSETALQKMEEMYREEKGRREELEGKLEEGLNLVNQLQAQLREWEAKKLAEEDAAKKKLLEDEEAKKLLEEDEAKKLMEEKAKKLLEEDEARQRLEVEAKNRSEDEANKLLEDEGMSVDTQTQDTTNDDDITEIPVVKVPPELVIVEDSDGDEPEAVSSSNNNNGSLAEEVAKAAGRAPRLNTARRGARGTGGARITSMDRRWASGSRFFPVSPAKSRTKAGTQVFTCHFCDKRFPLRGAYNFHFKFNHFNRSPRK